MHQDNQETFFPRLLAKSCQLILFMKMINVCVSMISIRLHSVHVLLIPKAVYSQT